MEIDFVSIMHSLSNFIENERVAHYNQGVDAERVRCAKIADEHAASQCTGQGSETAAMRLGAQSIASAIRSGD